MVEKWHSYELVELHRRNLGLTRIETIGISDGVLLFPSGWFTPQDDGLYAQPHEDFLEVYRNAALITAFFQPTPLGKGVAGGMASLLGTLLFIDDVQDGTFVDNTGKVYDFATSITGDGSPSEDDAINESTFDVSIEDDFNTIINFKSGHAHGLQGTDIRCHATLDGEQCDREMGHTGPHRAYLSNSTLQWRDGDDFNSRTRY